MSILSWDDFEDDSQKPAAPEHKSAPVEPQKAPNSQMVSACRATIRRMWQLHNPLRATRSRATNPTDPLARASNALENLDVAPGLRRA